MTVDDAMAPIDVLELERKYHADGAAVLPDLTGIAGVATVTSPETTTLDATYYDTTDLRLLRAGITLRRRTGGADAGWHLKLPLGKDARTELRAPLGETDSPPPQEFSTLLTARLRAAVLEPATRLTTRREQRRLLSAAGVLLVEVVVDTVRAREFAPDAEPIEWQEIEVEWAEGAMPVADEVDRRLGAAGIERAGHSSKLARALETRLAAVVPATIVGRRSTLTELLAVYLREQLSTVIEGDLAYRRELPDAVHRIRVATRRARSVLAAYAKDRQDVRSLIDEIRWLGIELGAARDVEVVRERVLARLAELAPQLNVGPVAARIDTHFSAETDAARGRALAALNSARYVAILESLDAIAATLRIGRADDLRATRVVPQLLDRMTETVDKRVKAVRRTSAGPERDALAHSARKAVKRLRYAIEAVRPLAPRRTDRVLITFIDLQNILGDHQDSIVAQRKLLQLATEAERSGEGGFTYGALGQVESEIAADALRKLPAAWKTSRRATRTMRLG